MLERLDADIGIYASGNVRVGFGPGLGSVQGFELGHDQVKAPIDERLARFVRHYPKARTELNMNVAVVDLRYPSGFALRPIASAAPAGKQESKGK